MIWNEQMIRSEIEKLDEITGLEGSKLPIYFAENSNRDVIACYSPYKYFVFFKSFSGEAVFPIEEQLDTIRHEYAHYMDHVLYNHVGHDGSWITCCRLIGARPSKTARAGQSNYFYDLYLKESQQWPRYETYKSGDLIEHPKYGVGIIDEIKGEVFSRRLAVSFESGESKYLSLPWVDKNCKRIA